MLDTKQAQDALRTLERAREWQSYHDPDDEGGHSSQCATYDPIQAGDCDCGWDKFLSSVKEYLQAWPGT